MGSAVDEDGDGHLSELVTGGGEDLGASQRTELADGEDLAVGRPRLGRPPVTARVDGLAHPQASARVAGGVWPVSPSSMQNAQIVQ